jgi:hypothetical protein
MKEKIHAVSNKNLAELIRSLGLAEELEKEKLVCSFCKNKLSYENIGCIYPLKNEIRLSCNSLKCLERTLEEITPLRKISSRGEEDNES